MGNFLEGLGKQLEPHAAKLNNTIAATGVMLHHRMELIEQHLSDLKRPDVGDHFFRIRITGTFKAERTTLAEVPINEYWPVQYFATAGTREKTPAFTIEFNDILMLAFNKEGTGAESPGGDLVALPGEKIELVPEAEGKFEATLIVVRVRIPTNKIVPVAGLTKGRLITSNTHEPDRDLIGSATGIYTENSQETLPGHKE
jgi:hypothetical protein